MGEMTAFVNMAAGLSGVLLGWLAFGRGRHKDMTNGARLLAQLQLDMEYIKKGVDDIRGEQRAMRQDFAALAERVTRVEESAKSLRHRFYENIKPC